jgi:molybdopterin synthase sulfur carrier subunit
MTLRVLYFASLREALCTSGESIEVPDGVISVCDLRAHIAARGEPWAALATVKNLRAAVNQAMVGIDATLKDGDEVAFFPPVTGG